MRDARTLSIAELDRIESNLKPGQGVLDVFGVTRGGQSSGVVGGGLSYQHRINGSMSAFANGLIGHGWGEYQPLSWEATAGWRVRF